MISKTCLYALKSVTYIARNEAAGYVTIQQISDRLGISFTFLTKILQQLSSAGILESRKGPGGGVKLAKNQVNISFLDIIRAVDERCIQALETHHSAATTCCGNCALKKQLDIIQTNVAAMMDNVTIADITSGGRKSVSTL